MAGTIWPVIASSYSCGLYFLSSTTIVLLIFNEPQLIAYPAKGYLLLTDEVKAEIHYDSLYRFAISLTRHAIDAEDLVHQTYLKWLKNRDKIRNTDRTKSWLFTTLYREFLHTLKIKSKQTLMETDQLDSLAQAKNTDAGNKLDAEYAMALMQQIPEPFRSSLALFYIEDFSYREIADVLEIAPGTVMSRIFRGKQILKEMMTTMKNGQPAEPGGGAS